MKYITIRYHQTSILCIANSIHPHYTSKSHINQQNFKKLYCETKKKLTINLIIIISKERK